MAALTNRLSPTSFCATTEECKEEGTSTTISPVSCVESKVRQINSSSLDIIISGPIERLAAKIELALEAFTKTYKQSPLSNLRDSSLFLAKCLRTSVLKKKDCRINKKNTHLFKRGILISKIGEIYIDFPKSKFGDGTYKKVKLCFDLFSQKIKARLVAKPKDTQQTLAEIKTTEKLQGLGVVEIGSSAMYVNKKGEAQVAIFQLLYKKSLDQLENINELSDDCKQKIALQLLSGLARISQFGSHRDIKPANILLDEENNACITDFGFYADREVEDDSLCGTIDWTSPEYLNSDGKNKDKLDVWSMGLILYYLFYPKSPNLFWNKEYLEVLQKIKGLQQGWQDQIPYEPQHPIEPLIKQMLEVDPKHRISAEDAFKGAQTLFPNTKF